MHVLLIEPGKRKGFAAPFGHVEPLGLESIAGAISDFRRFIQTEASVLRVEGNRERLANRD